MLYFRLVHSICDSRLRHTEQPPRRSQTSESIAAESTFATFARVSQNEICLNRARFTLPEVGNDSTLSSYCGISVAIPQTISLSSIFLFFFFVVLLFLFPRPTRSPSLSQHFREGGARLFGGFVFLDFWRAVVVRCTDGRPARGADGGAVSLKFGIFRMPAGERTARRFF